MAFNRDRSGGGFRKRGFNDRGGFGGRGFDRLQMHQAVCDKCRKDCEVPFRPTGGKPVYCSDCFDRPQSRRPEGRSFDRPNFRPENRGAEVSGPRYDEQFAALNAKLDKILNTLVPVAQEAEVEAESMAEETEPEEIKAPKKPRSKKV